MPNFLPAKLSRYTVISFTLLFLSCIVLQPNITDISITPGSKLLHQFNEFASLTCTAEGGPRIKTRWQFDNGSSVVTVVSGSSNVTYNVLSLSTEHTGVYYCEAIIDEMTDNSMNYTLFGEFVAICTSAFIIVYTVYPSHTHTHTHTHTNTHTHTHTHTHTCTLYTHAHTHTRTHRDTCIHAHTHVDMHAHRHTCIKTQIHTHIHSCVHTYIHTCTCKAAYVTSFAKTLYLCTLWQRTVFIINGYLHQQTN